MSLSDKLDVLVKQFDRAQAALQHETSVKEKCVERISKLSQTMSFQVVEHEKTRRELDEKNQKLTAKLNTMDVKYAEAERMLTDLQHELEQLKQSVRLPTAASASDCSSDSSTVTIGSERSPMKTQHERHLLQQFSARLETAMREAKAVVDHKDRVINGLESQLRDLQDAQREGELTVTRERDGLKEKLALCQAEVARLEHALQCASADREAVKTSLQQECENTRRELEAQRSRCSELEDAVNVTAKNEGQLRQEVELLTREMHSSKSLVHDLKASMEEKMTEYQRLHDELEHVRTTSAKEKRKLEKKLRVLLSERKHLYDEATRGERSRRDEFDRLNKELSCSQTRESELALTVTRLEESLDVLEARAVQAERQRDELCVKLEEMKRKCEAMQERVDSMETTCNAARQRLSELEDEKRELQEHATLSEQALARQIVQKEVAITADYERRMRDLMERHSQELVARDLALRRAVEENEELQTSLRRSQAAQWSDPAMSRCSCGQLSSSSSSSSSLSSAVGPTQRDLDHLDAAVESPVPRRSPNSKPKSSSKDRSTKRKLEDRVRELQSKIGELTNALATANEQETIVKAAMEQQREAFEQHEHQRDELLRQVNELRHENWSLTLALQVSERRSS
ncbi:hypothetical protein PINS_up010804 [Pythium insidiosum]|nr:hypothetical protein PINS_up010804 [Pythium insidiosum]